jgi:hypothetical protein
MLASCERLQRKSGHLEAGIPSKIFHIGVITSHFR